MQTQTQAGKAFEYALIKESRAYFSKYCNVFINENASFVNAEKCFLLFSEHDKEKYLQAATAAIMHIVELEPRLVNPLLEQDILNLQLVPDSQGQKGDVRDILFIRSLQNWEIGISAKNNHKAVKHSRLSDKIDFGKEWLQLNCSLHYFEKVNPKFENLREFRKKEVLWRNLTGKHTDFYIPILEAFKEELLLLDKQNPESVPAKLVEYLIGKKDFYKVIKRHRKTEIYGFNFGGTLNKSFNKIKPVFKVPKLRLPTRIIEFAFKKNSSDTLILTCDEGWQISFRIHNASSIIEPSLKFDINLIGQPQTLYSHHTHW